MDHISPGPSSPAHGLHAAPKRRVAHRAGGEPQPEVEVEGEPEPEVEVESEPEPEPESEVEPEPEPEVEVEVEFEVESEGGCRMWFGTEVLSYRTIQPATICDVSIVYIHAISLVLALVLARVGAHARALVLLFVLVPVLVLRLALPLAGDEGFNLALHVEDGALGSLAGDDVVVAREAATEHQAGGLR